MTTWNAFNWFNRFHIIFDMVTNECAGAGIMALVNKLLLARLASCVCISSSHGCCSWYPASCSGTWEIFCLSFGLFTTPQNPEWCFMLWASAWFNLCLNKKSSLSFSLISLSLYLWISNTYIYINTHAITKKFS